MQDFSTTLTLAAGWQNLLARLVAAGYTGRSAAIFVTIQQLNAVAVSVKQSGDQDAPASNAAPSGLVLNNSSHTWTAGGAPVIDLAKTYLHAAAATSINISLAAKE